MSYRAWLYELQHGYMSYRTWLYELQNMVKKAAEHGKYALQNRLTMFD